MSEETEGGFKVDDREAGEVFMLSFGAIGALALLDAEPARASLPAGPAPLTPEEAQTLLSGAPAPLSSDDLAPPAPAAADAAFLSALAAFAGASDAGPAVFFPRAVTTDVAVPDFEPASAPSLAEERGDEAIGSSTPPLMFSSAGVVHGDNLLVTMAAGATLTLAGQNDLVVVASNDVINVLSGSSVAVIGGGASVNLASIDLLSLTGTRYKVHAAGPGDVVTLHDNSQATIYGDGVQTNLTAPSSTATVIGSANTIEAAAATVTVGGGSDPASANTVFVQSGAINLMDMSALAAHGNGAAYLGANDYVSLFGTFDIYAPQATGISVIASFGGSDTLFLHSSYGDISALLGGVTETSDAATLHLSAKDSLTLTGLDKSQLSAFVNSGHIHLN